VLGCRADWAERHPSQLSALIRALYAAAQWCEDPTHHDELARLLSEPRFVGVPAAVLLRGLSNRLQLHVNDSAREVPDFYVPARQAATFPWISHALWSYTQMVRWEQTRFSAADFAAARGTYRPDLYRSALASMGVNLPTADLKKEGSYPTCGRMPGTRGDLSYGPDGFFDGRAFAPGEISEHVAAGAIPIAR
jgi:two-component system, oxyanion-binding sensor